LVTTDFSEASDRGLPTAFALARQNEAKVTLCHVVEYLSRPNPLYAHYAPVETVEPEVQHRATERARELLRERIPADWTERTDIALPQGPPADEILRVAREQAVDLIVIARSGHTGIIERLLGGVAYRVVRHAHCPVLVIR
jgi:nucleotide-binding universal stress UspA family protein